MSMNSTSAAVLVLLARKLAMNFGPRYTELVIRGGVRDLTCEDASLNR